MVVEVVVSDGVTSGLDEPRGEPRVTINGKQLRMAQASDGNWYAYFANVNHAMAADQTSLDGGVPGGGLDFGVFCGGDTAASVLGVDFSSTDGIAVPSGSGLTGFSNGMLEPSDCTGRVASGDNLNNVVRRPRSLNTNSDVAPGQIGLDPNAWPVIQLYSFGDVTITYNPAGQAQTVRLGYGDIPNISMDLDRDLHPAGSEVFVTILDAQLNQDPTDEDHWTFAVGGDRAVFYDAFASVYAANILTDLDDLGFDDNGLFYMTLDSILTIGTNDNQPSARISEGAAVYDIVTFAETRPNSGVFQSSDRGNDSVIEVRHDAPRGRTDTVTYNGESKSILTGFSTASIATGRAASISLPNTGNWAPGTRIPVTVVDQDQNVNSGKRDSLDTFKSTAIIPTLVIGNPVTLESASGVVFYGPGDAIRAGTGATSSVPDKNSALLMIDASSVPDMRVEMISINLGIRASDLAGMLAGAGVGTNWLNYDLRSLSHHLGLNDLSGTSISLYFGGLGNDSVRIVEPGDMGRLWDLIMLDADDVDHISASSGDVFMVIDLGGAASVSGQSGVMPIAVDFFSFGLAGGRDINNSVYRFTLEETADNSGTFVGTLEYALFNQLNIGTSDLIETLRPIDDDVKFAVTGRMLDADGITISYSDVASAGTTGSAAVKSPILTHSGTVTTDKTSYGFGRPVTIILNDPDLNLRDDQVDIYSVISDPDSENVDAVGSPGGALLLEIEIKGIKYKRCMIDGIEHGGLAATGFALVETTPNSGIFEGVFKMPSRICNGPGTGLIYTSGGSVDVRYFDFRDSSGEENIVTLSRQAQSRHAEPQLNAHEFDLSEYPYEAQVVLTGTVNGHKRGTPVEIVLEDPGHSRQNFAVYPTSSGSYMAIMTLNSDSVPGSYIIHVSYGGEDVASTGFLIRGGIPDDIRDIIADWTEYGVPDHIFKSAIRDLAEQRLFEAGDNHDGTSKNDSVPDWIRETSGLWIRGVISESEYLDALEFLVKKGILVT